MNRPRLRDSNRLTDLDLYPLNNFPKETIYLVDYLAVGRKYMWL